MRFKVKAGTFRRLGEVTEYGTVPLQSVPDGYSLFLPLSAAPLLELQEGWHDMEALVRGLGETQRREWEDALVLLSCFGIAERETAAEPQEGVFVAGEREYGEVAAFIRAARKTGFCYLLEGGAEEEYFSLSAIRERQFNNREYYFQYKRDGKILAVLFVTLLPKETFSAALLLGGFLAGSGGAEERRGWLRALLQRISSAFSRDFAKLRFLCKSEAEEGMLQMLREAGFGKTAVLEHELPDGRPVAIYDYALHDRR